VVVVEHGSGQAASGALGGAQGVEDEFDAHVVGDGPADQATRAQIRHRGQVEERAVVDRQIRDVGGGLLGGFALGLGYGRRARWCAA
jgi:hypothetical protein